MRSALRRRRKRQGSRNYKVLDPGFRWTSLLSVLSLHLSLFNPITIQIALGPQTHRQLTMMCTTGGGYMNRSGFVGRDSISWDRVTRRLGGTRSLKTPIQERVRYCGQLLQPLDGFSRRFGDNTFQLLSDLFTTPCTAGIRHSSKGLSYISKSD